MSYIHTYNTYVYTYHDIVTYICTYNTYIHTYHDIVTYTYTYNTYIYTYHDIVTYTCTYNTYIHTYHDTQSSGYHQGVGNNTMGIWSYDSPDNASGPHYSVVMTPASSPGWAVSLVHCNNKYHSYKLLSQKSPIHLYVCMHYITSSRALVFTHTLYAYSYTVANHK